MKKKNILNIISIIIIILIISCDKEATSYPDYRYNILGTYNGIQIDTRLSGTWIHDTTFASMIISKSTSDSIINLQILSASSNESYQFKYSNNVFTSVLTYHAPQLWLSNDTLFYHIQTTLAPIYGDCICKKVK